MNSVRLTVVRLRDVLAHLLPGVTGCRHRRVVGSVVLAARLIDVVTEVFWG
ncbi:MAG: hypothetical protein LBH48_00960 [Bifidobacteriaceae bacterium]|nr:hypothetical protein [Bifidobacteriaceae bacterium]